MTVVEGENNTFISLSNVLYTRIRAETGQVIVQY